MRKRLLGALAGLLACLGVAAAIAQTSNYWPMPSNVCLAKGAVLVAQDVDKVTCVADVAAGQVFASGGVGALPAFTGAPSFGTSITVGASTPTAITNIRVYSQTITPASVASAVCAEQTFTVTGLATTDKVVYNPVATGNATSAGQVRVSATNTLAVTYCNPTAGALTPAAGTANIVAIRS